MKNTPQKNIFLLKHNLFFTFFALFVNAAFFYLIPNSSKNFFEYSLLINGFLLYFYYSNLFSIMRKKLIGIKKEFSYTNFPIRVLFLFLIFIGILIFNIFTLYQINENAINIVFISNLFINTICIHIPLIILFIFVYLITPASIIPKYDNSKYKKANKILTLLLVFLLLFFGFELIKSITTTKETNNTTKYDLEKISYEYNDKFLKFIDINEISKEELKQEKATFPFSYTKKNSIAFSYTEAEKFCNSLNANVASIPEMYNILFHKFELKGDQYYWTRNKVGRIPLLFHFKDLDYEVVKPKRNSQANVICTTTQNKKNLFVDPTKIQKEVEKYETDIDEIETEINTTETTIKETEIDNNSMRIPSEFVSFNIKFVPEKYFEQMIKKGYSYKKDVNINPANLVYNLSTIKNIKSDNLEIKLCHFPFIEYENFSIAQEKEVWKQNFCSPAFEILDVPQAEKTQYEKDTYCMAYGGRLPNISELSGIIKATKKISLNKNYWVSNTIEQAGTKKHIYLNNLNQEIIKAKIAENKEIASVICIKNPQKKSNIITNFSSKFINEDGAYYAKQKCPKCDYFEMPDMVLNQ